MQRIRLGATRLCALVLLAISGFLLAIAGCESDLDGSFEGKACSASRQCIDGYVCDITRNVCVRNGSFDAAAGSAGFSGSSSGCPDGLTACDGKCVDLDQDVANCGRCGAVCTPPAFGSPVCNQRTCDFVCSPVDRCGSKCVDLQSDSETCGMCGRVCPPVLNGVPACRAAACGVTCHPGFGDCSGQCLDLQSNHDHCGDCSVACASDKVCGLGNCLDECPSELFNCMGSCVDLKKSADHCGSCNNLCRAPRGGQALCKEGICEVDCPDLLEPCGDACVDMTSDPAHCGRCGNACGAPADGTAVCMNSVCDFTCKTGFAKCGDRCVSPGTAPIDCECPDGQRRCGGVCTDTSTNPAHCGACLAACPLRPNAAVSTCVDSKCGFGCKPGFTDCDGVAENGCEVVTATNVDHCGACGRACATNQVQSRSCSGGLCTSTCILQNANCLMPAAPAADDGCEQPAVNSQVCGGCANSCALGASAGLVCDGPQANVCSCTSPTQCRGLGASGNCSTSSGLCSCSGTTCNTGEICRRFGSGSDFCSCNNGPSCMGSDVCCRTPAGCRNVNIDPANCGACGHACPPGFACASAVCRCMADVQCDAGGGGVCNASGSCVCGATPCAVGQRCQPGGVCG